MYGVAARGLFLAILVAAIDAAAHQTHQHRSARPFGWPSRGKDDSFDYVVIGGGTAGLTVATRLAQGSTFSVAVIEAGGFYEQDNGNFSTIPGYCTFFTGTDPDDVNPLVDWGFVTQPLKSIIDVCTTPVVRLSEAPQRGTTCTINGKSLCESLYDFCLMLGRPNAGALDRWAATVGDDSYKFDNLLPFYKKSVHYTSPTVLSTNSTNNQDPNAWSSTGGPLQVSHGKFVDPFGTWIQPAAEKLGMTGINGFQSGKLLGSGYVPFTVDPEKSHRSSSESSFLKSVNPKARLTVYNNALAEKVLLNAQNTATGVVVTSNGTTFTLQARFEVIVSAGTFQSPQILMLSGIGPADTLAKYKIPVRINLPGVGSNYQDHPWFSTQYRVRVPTTSAAALNPSLQALNQQAYESRGTGPLTIPTTGFLAWEKVPDRLRKNLSQATLDALATLSADWPELEYLPVGGAIGYNRNYQKEDPKDGYNYASITTLLSAPFSRGTVTISSAKAADLPLIDPNYFSHPADVELAITAVRRLREFWAQMQGVTIGQEYLPGPDVDSDEEILHYIKSSLGLAPHAAGTCRMGKRGDPSSVVDSQGRVLGARNLRVVDASVFPFLPPGHIQATVYAIAEKIADGILHGR
ncbi:MAG: hypothetical protein Q9200_007325 [Gallowayella weberi]